MRDSPALGISGVDAALLLERLAGLTAGASLLQCDVRSMLTPALLSADMLLRTADPVVARQAEIVIEAITRVVDRVG